MSAAFGRGTKCARLESVVEDLKPVDLCLARLKPDESWVEDRTVADLQIARRRLGESHVQDSEEWEREKERPMDLR